MKVVIGYYLTERYEAAYHLSRAVDRDRHPNMRSHPLCGTASGLRQLMNWNWTRQPLTVEKARVRVKKQKHRFCQRCDQLAEKLRDPISRLGELAMVGPEPDGE